MTPIEKLAKALKEAAMEYTRETGKQFRADFNFVQQRTIESTGIDYFCNGVTVKATEEIEL